MGDSIQSALLSPEPDSVMVKDYAVGRLFSMFQHKQNTDVVFGFKDSSVTYAAHQLVLAIWSPYFTKYFYENKPLPDIVYLEETDPEAFYFMLRFFYDDNPEIETCDKALKILNIAKKYQVKKLIIDVLEFVKNFQPEVHNVLDVLNAALHMHLQSQITNCSEFIQCYTWGVMNACPCNTARCTCMLPSVTPKVIGHVLDLTELSLPSYVILLDWFFDWVIANFKSDDTSFTDCCHNMPCLGKVFEKNSELASFLPKISFLSLSEAEFDDFCVLHLPHFSGSFLTADDALRIKLYLSRPGICLLPPWTKQNSNAVNGSLSFNFPEGRAPIIFGDE